MGSSEKQTLPEKLFPQRTYKLVVNMICADPKTPGAILTSYSETFTSGEEAKKAFILFPAKHIAVHHTSHTKACKPRATLFEITTIPTGKNDRRIIKQLQRRTFTG